MKKDLPKPVFFSIIVVVVAIAAFSVWQLTTPNEFDAPEYEGEPLPERLSEADPEDLPEYIRNPGGGATTAPQPGNSPGGQ